MRAEIFMSLLTYSLLLKFVGKENLPQTNKFIPDFGKSQKNIHLVTQSLSPMSMELVNVRLRRSQEGGIMGWEGNGIRLMVQNGQAKSPRPSI